MMPLSALNVALAEHQARVERANKYGWMVEELRLAESTRPRARSKVLDTTRLCIGAAVIWIGRTLQGTSAGDAGTLRQHPVEPAP